jgi:hypothetical protein
MSGLTEGAHSASIYAVDLAGNQGTAVSYSWTVDLTPPTTTISSETPNWSPTANTSITVNFTASEPASFACALDNGTFTGCNGTWTVSGLADGTHTISVKATDLAGNTGPVATYSWIVNTTTLAISSVSVSMITSSSAVITWTTNFAATSQVGYGISSPSQNTITDGTFVLNHSMTLTGLTANSLYQVQATSVDKDGRTATSTMVNFRTTH